MSQRSIHFLLLYHTFLYSTFTLLFFFVNERGDDLTLNINGVLDGTSLDITCFLIQRIFNYNTRILQSETTVRI